MRIIREDTKKMFLVVESLRMRKTQKPLRKKIILSIIFFLNDQNLMNHYALGGTLTLLVRPLKKHFFVLYV